jgi:hypothetical protein
LQIYKSALYLIVFDTNVRLNVKKKCVVQISNSEMAIV